MLQLKPYKLARKCRIAVSIAVLAGVTYAVGVGHSCWLRDWQLVPAIMAGSTGWLLLWTAVTALFGRIYCSTACPLGTLQDIFARIGHRKYGYFYSEAKNAFRWTMVAVAAIAAGLGVSAITGILDPASLYDRFVMQLGRPAIGSAAFAVGSGLMSAALLAVIAAVSLRRGRLLCNTVCPVGTLLGGLSRTSLYHIDIDTDKCIGCGRCTERCKAECINPDAHTVDLSRCVVCFDCVDVCPNSAITFRRGQHQLQIPMLQSIVPKQPESATATCGKNSLKCTIKSKNGYNLAHNRPRPDTRRGQSSDRRRIGHR